MVKNYKEMVSVATEATSLSFIPIAGMAAATSVGTRASLTPKSFIARAAAIAPSGVIACPVLPRYPPSTLQHGAVYVLMLKKLKTLSLILYKY